MFLSPDSLKDLLGTVALMSLLSVAYGSVMRACDRPWLGRTLLGLLFGGAAALAMHDPVSIAPGVVMDLRNLPLALAGAFLGLEGLGAALAVAAAARLGFGGADAASGILALALSGAAGQLWAARTGEAGPRGRQSMAGLAALAQAHWLAALTMPAAAIGPFYASTLPVFAPLEILGILVVGSLLERERGFVAVERRLSREGEEDALTGLLNRRGFERGVGLARRRGGAGAVLVADIDHFKRINDVHGHAVGDDILRALVPRLRAALRPGDVVARLGGDEIGIYLPGVDVTRASAVGERLCQAVRGADFAVPEGPVVPVTISVGGAFSREELSLDAMVGQADVALYGAKRGGRDRCRFLPGVEGLARDARGAALSAA